MKKPGISVVTNGDVVKLECTQFWQHPKKYVRKTGNMVFGACKHRDGTYGSCNPWIPFDAEYERKISTSIAGYFEFCEINILRHEWSDQFTKPVRGSCQLTENWFLDDVRENLAKDLIGQIGEGFHGEDMRLARFQV